MVISDLITHSNGGTDEFCISVDLIANDRLAKQGDVAQYLLSGFTVKIYTLQAAMVF